LAVGADAALETAREVLRYAEEELEKAVKTGDLLLYRNAADKALLAAVLAVNAYVSRKLGVVPKSHSERRLLLRRMGREDLRALYSDVMKTLHDEAFYEGVYNPEEVEYAIEKVKQLLKEVENVQNRK
jgi:HEPN domain-containing protein